MKKENLDRLKNACSEMVCVSSFYLHLQVPFQHIRVNMNRLATSDGFSFGSISIFIMVISGF